MLNAIHAMCCDEKGFEESNTKTTSLFPWCNNSCLKVRNNNSGVVILYTESCFGDNSYVWSPRKEVNLNEICKPHVINIIPNY
jgi:hypothetical protein